MSTLRTDTLQNAAGTASVPVETVVNGSAKAWVNFNGTVASPTVRASFNVSSVVKTATGNYLLTFTNAMPDANYVVAGSTNDSASATDPNTMGPTNGSTYTASQVRIFAVDQDNANRDGNIVGVVIFR